MALQEQIATALTFQRLDHLERLRLVLDWIGTNQGNGFIPEVTGRPNRAECWMHKVGTTAGVWGFADFNQGRQLAFLGVNHANLVAVVGCHHEIALG